MQNFVQKGILTALLCCFGFYTQAQPSFESGYYVDNEGARHAGLVRSLAAGQAVNSITFKASENAEAEKLKIDDMRAFGIGESLRYQRFLVEIDRSTNDIEKMSGERAPTFTTETLLLRLLVEGKADLFVYEDGDFVRFFYRTAEKEEVEQLVYKRYRLDNGEVAKNVGYRTQIFENLNCGAQGELRDKVADLSYTRSSLISFFRYYNECAGGEAKVYDEVASLEVHLTPRLGLRSTNFSIQVGPDAVGRYRESDLSGKVGVRFGVALEFVLPVGRKNWSVLAEPTIQSYTNEGSITRPDGTVNISYTSLEFPIALRYYGYVDERSAFFVNAGLLFDLGGADAIEVDEVGRNFTVSFARVQGIVGAGFRYNERLTLELRHGLSTNAVDFSDWDAQFGYWEFVVGVSVF